MYARILALWAAMMLLFGAAALAEHTHAPAEMWDRDLKEHWHNCLTCGEKLEAQAHEMSNETCTLCGSEIWLFDDGMGDVTNYNVYGDYTRTTSYEADGTISYDASFEYEYDADGVLLFSKQYDSGVLVEEITYTLNDDGERQFVKQIGYNDDGTLSVNEYDKNGNVVKALLYDAQGKVVYQDITEYALSSVDGYYYVAKRTSTFEDGSGSVTVNNEYSDRISIVYYRADGSVDFRFDHEYEYDNQGRKLKEKVFYNGTLQEETDYAVYEDENGWWTNPVTSIYYEEGGAQTVTVYDENGDEVTNDENETLEESVG